MVKKKNGIVAALERLLFPTRCVLCSKLLEQETGDICPECLTAARVFYHEPWKITHVKSWLAMWQYTGTVRDSLVRYKFWHRRSYCVTYGRELAQKLQNAKLTYDVITWVPISFLRRVERGYDQVELIAYEVGKHLNDKPVKLLHKHRHNRRQSSIRGFENRRQNVRGVYRVVSPEQVAGKRILLLEDIITSGATVSECAHVLKEAGAKEVHAACVAVASRYQR